MKLVVALLAFLIPFIPTPAHASTGGWINEYRAEHGLPPLHANDYLNYKALQWARHMVAVNSLYHGDLPAFGAYHTVGQNIGYGPTWWSIEEAFYHSPEHRANILCRCYSQVGVAVVRSGDLVWVVQDFRG